MSELLLKIINLLVSNCSDADLENAASLIADYQARYPKSFKTVMRDISPLRPEMIQMIQSEFAYRNQNLNEENPSLESE